MIDPSPARAAPNADNVLPLRHVAALLVIYGHSYDLSGAPAEGDLVTRLLPGFKAGSLGVYVFFALSGFLLMRSLIARPELLRYLRHRALRILPAYWVCLLACVLLLGPTFSSLGAVDYFRHPETWAHLSGNILPLSFVWGLPGVFTDHVFPEVVNGSLWSLGLELRWYGYLALLLALGLAQRRWAFSVVAVLFLAVAAAETLAGKPDPLHYRALSVVFVLGALWAHWWTWHRPRHSGLLACLALALLCHGSAWTGAANTLLVLYASLWAAYALPALPWSSRRDYSYGLYLYGFPVQQSLLALYPALSPLALCVWASLVALLLAWLSWHLVEQPMLRWRSLGAPGARLPSAPVAAA